MSNEIIGNLLRDVIGRLERIEDSSRAESTNAMANASSRPQHRSISTDMPGPSNAATTMYSRSRRLSPYNLPNERNHLFRPSHQRAHHRHNNPKPKAIAKWHHEFVCLAYKGQCRIPLPMEKIELVHANLGPSHLELTLNGNSQIFHEELIKFFPKLKECGGYELLRGSDANNRDLTVIAPPMGGYTASFLKSIVSHAKIYIRPLQANLSLDVDIDENSVQGPQEICKGCNKTIPLYRLGQHLSTCDTAFRSSASMYSNPSEVVLSPLPSPPMNLSPMSIGGGEVDSDEERLQQGILRSTIEAAPDKELKSTTLEILIQNIRADRKIVVPADIDAWFDLDRTTIDIRRNNLFDDAINAAKKADFDVCKLLQVNFIGEPAVDAGGPSREFFQLFLQEFARKLMISCPNGSKIFDHNVPSLQKLEFKISGQYVAMSIIQGGPAFPVLSLPLFKYLSVRRFQNDFDITNEDVPNDEVYILLKKIEEANTHEAMAMIFEKDDNKLMVMETGYRGYLNSLESKPSLMAVLRDYYSIIRIIPEIEQFASGLECLFSLNEHFEQLKPVFLYKNEEVIAQGFFKTFFEPQFSRAASVKEKEEEAYLFFLKYIKECEDGCMTTGTKMNVEVNHILAFITGVNTVPPLGFATKPKIHFTDSILATASTCDLTLYLPCCHRNYNEFKEYFTEAIIASTGYGMA